MGPNDDPLNGAMVTRLLKLQSEELRKVNVANVTRFYTTPLRCEKLRTSMCSGSPLGRTNFPPSFILKE